MFLKHFPFTIQFLLQNNKIKTATKKGLFQQCIISKPRNNTTELRLKTCERCFYDFMFYYYLYEIKIYSTDECY